jgi:hypothetical protein
LGGFWQHKKATEVHLQLCGAVMSKVIEQRKKREELPLKDCSWPSLLSSSNKFKILSVMGTISRYLEELRPDLSPEENVQRLCFLPEGLLFREFDRIFHDLFLNRAGDYKKIVQPLVEQPLSAKEISLKLGRSTGGDLSEALTELTQASLLARDHTWHLAAQQKSKVSRYRIRDNYLRFYLKCIQPNAPSIKAGMMKNLPPEWHSILELQFENLVVNNGASLLRILGIQPEELIFSGPYLQTAQTRRKSCQIDYLVQVKYNGLYACEAKFKEGLIGMEVVDEMKQKLETLQIPRNFSCRPVLLHVNGVKAEVADSGFFAKIVDFSELLV